MSVRISQSEDQATGSVILRVEGSLTADAAELLNDICAGLIKQSGAKITINVAQVRFLDEDGAAVLRGLKQQGVSFEGCELFTQRVVESTEPS
ncbi:MAG TPA: STAS domain-containing protein [Blastocatellia bacterium]|nr:STAS domain-containing protein [Blastocatellia bacterium]